MQPEIQTFSLPASKSRMLSSPATTESPRPPITLLAPQLAGPKTELFFTYGSLMRGQSRGSVLAHSLFVGEGFVDPAELFDTGWGFPALRLGPSCEGVVWGEVFRIKPSLWRSIDMIENGLYARVEHVVEIPALAPGVRKLLCGMYEATAWDFKKLRRIPTGRWEDASS